MSNKIYRVTFYYKDEAQRRKRCDRDITSKMKAYTKDPTFVEFWCNWCNFDGKTAKLCEGRKTPFVAIFMTPSHQDNPSMTDYTLITTFPLSKKKKIIKVLNFLYDAGELTKEGEFSINEFSQGANVLDIIKSPLPSFVKVQLPKLPKWLLWGGLAAIGIGYLNSQND